MAKRVLLKNQLQTLGTLKRIQDQRKREAQLALVEAQVKGEEQRSLVQGWEQRLDEQEEHRSKAKTPADLLQHSQFRMRAEMHRRQSIRTLQEMDRDITQHREALTRELRESKTLEKHGAW